MGSPYNTGPLSPAGRVVGYAPRVPSWPDKRPTWMDGSSPKRLTAARRPDYRSRTASSPTLERIYVAQERVRE